MFGVWGSRTVGGHVFGCRNLDFMVQQTATTAIGGPMMSLVAE
jgi:hypothetical protein